MTDVIPGAKYEDTVFGRSFHCLGTVKRDGDRCVKVEYSETGAVITIPYEMFRSDNHFEIVELPSDR